MSKRVKASNLTGYTHVAWPDVQVGDVVRRPGVVEATSTGLHAVWWHDAVKIVDVDLFPDGGVCVGWMDLVTSFRACSLFTAGSASVGAYRTTPASQ